MIKVDGKEYPWRAGMTVADLLRDLPGPFYPYAVIRMNREIITEPFFVQTLIPDQAEIHLIPMVVGG